MTWVTMPLCYICWDKENPGRQALRMAEGYCETETCGICGALTESGIYQRREVGVENAGDGKDNGADEKR